MKIPFKQYWQLLSRFLQPQRGRVAWLAVILLSSIGLHLLNPLVLRYFIDTAVTGGAADTLPAVALMFIGIALVNQVLSVLATYLSENVSWTATNALRADLVEHCLSLDMSFHKAHTPGELIERVDGDVNTLAGFFSQFTIQVLGNMLLLVGIMVVLFNEDWRAGLSLTLFAGVNLVTLVRLRAFAVPYWANVRQMSAEFFGFLGEQLAGTEDIRANGATSYVLRRFRQILQRWQPFFQRAYLAGTTLEATAIGLITVGVVTALGVGAYLWNLGAITIGTVYLLYHYTLLLIEPVEQIRRHLEDLQRAEASIQRIRALFEIQSKLSQGGNQSLPAGALAVAFEDVSFSYDDAHEVTVTLVSQPESAQLDPQAVETTEKQVLHNITFSLLPGQVLGLLGRTGSGKTTLARLVARLYDPDQGCVRLGGVATHLTPVADLPRHVGLVTQDVQLFQASIRDNLTFFNEAISDERIQQTLTALGLSAWLQGLPQGLETELGPDGEGLSAGEAQLLAFARVFLKDPGLVILDEASSRLDPATERLVDRAVARLLQERTGIIIAHRLATVQRADVIMILENGRMSEFGPRETLANDPHSRFAQLLRTDLTELLA
jgi:ATP-binding cassette subfamily B protein/ATP-binding cassette subfamily C protein